MTSEEDSFDSILDNLRASVPTIVLDVPHQWTAWTKRLLISADDTGRGGSDLANLHAQNLLDLQRHPGETSRPHYCLNRSRRSQSAPRSPLPISPRRSTSTRSPLFRSIHRCSERRQQWPDDRENSRPATASQTFRQLGRFYRRIETKAKAGLLSPILEKLRKRA
jgi:pilus assembly protein CpaE